MPMDSKGRFHLNSQRAHASDRAAAGGRGSVQTPERETPENTGEGAGGSSSHLHDHGDGSFHIEHHDGSRTEHPHIGHALMHMAAKHAPGDKHMHVHHDGISHTTHHVGEDGKVEGPHEHAHMGELQDHMNSFFNEEAAEGEGEHGGGGYEHTTGKGLHGM